MVELDYDPASLCGPIDVRVVEYLAKYRHALDQSYLDHVQRSNIKAA